MGHLEAAMENARVKVDGRGLMPLAQARKIVKALDVYRKGDGEMIDGTFVLESDVAWAALLSLKDANEFLREAKRVRFEFHVRGMDNIAAFERYGDAVLAWVAANVHDGVLVNVPWCLLPCLLAVDGEEALTLALSIRAVSSDQRVGPGAYAADSAGDVDRTGNVVEEDRTVARSWVARGDRMALLAKRAESDPRARALLDELSPKLPAEVAAQIDAAPKLDVARGPGVSILELDEEAREYLFPIWDNTNYTAGAMRVTGVVSPEGDALVLQTITHWPSAGQGFVRETKVYGPGGKKRELQHEIVSSRQLDVWLDGDSTRLNRVTGVILRSETIGDKWKQHVVTPPGGTNATVRVQVGKESINLWSTFPDIPDLDAKKRKWARRVDPSLVVLFHLAEPPLREKLFFAPDAIPEAIGAPEGAQVLFSFDDWQHPEAGGLPSHSIDFVTMIAALAARAKIDRLPGEANCRFHHWLEHLAEHRCDPEAWGTGNPIDDPKPEGGVCLFTQNEQLMQRGWPHLVSWVHEHPWNEPKKAAEVVTQILNDGASMFRVTWAREIGFRLARALGASTSTIAPTDTAVKKALETGGPIGSLEAKAGLLVAVTRTVEIPAGLVEDHVLLLEASIGPEVVIDGALAALGKLGKTVPPNAVAVLDALGYVIERAPEKAAKKACEKLLTLAERWEGDLSKLAQLLAGKRPRTFPEAWLTHVDDRAYVQKKVAASKDPLRIDARIVTLGGPEILDAWRARLDTLETPPPWAVVQIGMLADPRAGDLLRAFIDKGIAADDAKTWLGYRKD